jgi:hypothetical protein
MATLREIIYDIRELVNAYSDDSNISDDHIAFMVRNTRNTLLKQQMSNLKRSIPKEALQVIRLSLEKDTDCFDGMTVLKSTIPVPATLDNTGRSDLHKVYAIGSRFIKNINVIDYSRIPYVDSQPYNHLQLFTSVDHMSNLVCYNSQGKHLLLENLDVEGLFEDPELAYLLSNKEDEDVPDFMDSHYPINAALISPLKNQVLQELLMKFRTPMDNRNDAEDGQTTGAAPAQNTEG